MKTEHLVIMGADVYESMLKGLLFYCLDLRNDDGALWCLNRLILYWTEAV